MIPYYYLLNPAPLNTRANHPTNYSTLKQTFSFFPRTVPEWNDLTSDQILAVDLDHFKSLLI